MPIERRERRKREREREKEREIEVTWKCAPFGWRVSEEFAARSRAASEQIKWPVSTAQRT